MAIRGSENPTNLLMQAFDAHRNRPNKAAITLIEHLRGLHWTRQEILGVVSDILDDEDKLDELLRKINIAHEKTGAPIINSDLLEEKLVAVGDMIRILSLLPSDILKEI